MIHLGRLQGGVRKREVILGRLLARETVNDCSANSAFAITGLRLDVTTTEICISIVRTVYSIALPEHHPEHSIADLQTTLHQLPPI